MADLTLCAGSAIRLSMYYSGGGIVPTGTVGFPNGVPTSIPSEGTISFSNFYGTSFIPLGLSNGDFEVISDYTETTTMVRFSGWTVMKQTVRMNGYSYILGFPTVNDPTPTHAGSPTPFADNVTISTDITPNPTYSVRLVDTSLSINSHLAVPGGSGKYVLELSLLATLAGAISLTNPNNYGIVRGPVMVSENSVNVNLGDQFEFNWRAEKIQPQGDRYDVIVYALEIFSGRTVLLLDARGETIAWQKSQTLLSDYYGQGTYKFVFVNGSQDSSGGLGLGARLYIDNVKVNKAGTFTPISGLYTPIIGPNSGTIGDYQTLQNRSIFVSIVGAPPYANYSIVITDPVPTALPAITGSVNENGVAVLAEKVLDQIGLYSYNVNFTSNISQITTGHTTKILNVSVLSETGTVSSSNPFGYKYDIIPTPNDIMEGSSVSFKFVTDDTRTATYTANVKSDSFGKLTLSGQNIPLPLVAQGGGLYSYSFNAIASLLDSGSTLANIAIKRNGENLTLTNPGTVRIRDSSIPLPNSPTIASVSPVSGPPSGGTTITITGAGFINPSLAGMDAETRKAYTISGVRFYKNSPFDGTYVQGTNTLVVSASTITVKTPSTIAVGTYDIQLQNQNGDPIGSSKTNAFTYLATESVVLDRTPSIVSEIGSGKVTLIGFGLTGATGVTVGGLAATNVTVVSDSEINFLAPRYVRQSQSSLEDNFNTGNYGADGVKFVSLPVVVTTPLGTADKISLSNGTQEPLLLQYHFAKTPVVYENVQDLSVDGGNITYQGIDNLVKNATTVSMVFTPQSGPPVVINCTNINVIHNRSINFDYPALPSQFRNAESSSIIAGAKMRFTTTVNYSPANYTSDSYTVDAGTEIILPTPALSYVLTKSTNAGIPVGTSITITLTTTGRSLDTDNKFRVPYRIFGVTGEITAADLTVDSLTGSFLYTVSTVNWARTATITVTPAASIVGKTGTVRVEILASPGVFVLIPLV